MSTDLLSSGLAYCESGNQAGSVPGQNLLSLPIGHFSPLDQFDIQDTKQEWCHKAVSF